MSINVRIWYTFVAFLEKIFFYFNVCKLFMNWDYG